MLYNSLLPHSPALHCEGGVVLQRMLITCSEKGMQRNALYLFLSI